jgi:D-3-phosphoglycerate dehydrogenase
VAEHAILLILAVYKRLVQAHMSLQSGQWLQFALRPVSYELHGKKLGLVGFGRIARETALRARAFGASILYYDPFLPASAAEECGFPVARVDLNTLLAESDIVSLHVPLTSDTRGMINSAAFARMKQTSVLINTARGALVVEKDLIAALESKTIAGAGLDVFEREPVQSDNPLFRMDNVIATPHISAGTKDALVQKMRAAFANFQRRATGASPINLVGTA